MLRQGGRNGASRLSIEAVAYYIVCCITALGGVVLLLLYSGANRDVGLILLGQATFGYFLGTAFIRLWEH
jgi:hypothetical protein